ncbi:MAG: helix-turn-helix domain-containing protein, partial [Deltaproteobacteria bacterium]|nr:helix-turn-helix domain-containing protein [Deltaproteobacteria bacterium]
AIEALPFAQAYLRKPVSEMELDKTINLAMEQQGPGPFDEAGGLHFDARACVLEDGRACHVDLTRGEQRVLSLLWGRFGEVVSHREIAELGRERAMVTAAEAAEASRKYAHRLRRKLAELTTPVSLESVHGAGYRLCL